MAEKLHECEDLQIVEAEVVSGTWGQTLRVGQDEITIRTGLASMFMKRQGLAPAGEKIADSCGTGYIICDGVEYRTLGEEMRNAA